MYYWVCSQDVAVLKLLRILQEWWRICSSININSRAKMWKVKCRNFWTFWISTVWIQSLIFSPAIEFMTIAFYSRLKCEINEVLFHLWVLIVRAKFRYNPWLQNGEKSRKGIGPKILLANPGIFFVTFSNTMISFLLAEIAIDFLARPATFQCCWHSMSRFFPKEEFFWNQKKCQFWNWVKLEGRASFETW